MGQWLSSIALCVWVSILAGCVDGSLSRSDLGTNRSEDTGSASGVEHPSVVQNEQRVALVIGNSDYQDSHLPKLGNPINDAEGISAVLRRFRFAVTTEKDLRRSAMRDAIAAFGRQATNANVALFYFAGHAFQNENRNYLFPIDATVRSTSDAIDTSVGINYILSEMDKAGSAIKIVMLDACRNNSFSAEFRTAVKPGLAPPGEVPKGTVMVYATDPGNTAADGDANNGLFTSGLLQAFNAQGQNVNLGDVVTSASEWVDAKSDHVQIPYVNGPPTLLKHFYFAGSAQDEAQNLRDQQVRLEKLRQETLAIESQLRAKQAQLVVTDQQLRQLPPPVVPSGVSTAPAVATHTTHYPFEPELVDIPAGSFMMGSPATEAGRISNEGPVHQVTVAAFQMGKYELTRGQFRAFVDASGYKTEAEQGDGCYGLNGSNWEKKKEYNWQNLGFSQTDAHPVACISWNDAQAYVKWLSQQTGKRYWLPTEAEWEYAARAGTTTARLWGDDPNSACQYANVADQASKRKFNWSPIHECDDGYVYTAPVGQFKPNAFGLYDMLGNVWEWCQDRYHNDYNGAPTIGSAWETGDSSYKVLRGGSWNSNPPYVRSALRLNYTPDHRYDLFGVRVASFAFART